MKGIGEFKLLRRGFFYGCAGCCLLAIPLFGNVETVVPERIVSLDEVWEQAKSKSTQLEIAQLNLNKMINNVDRVVYRYLPRLKFVIDGPEYITVNQEGRSPEEFDSLEWNGSIDLKNDLPYNFDVSANYTRSINNLARATERINFEVGKELLRKDPIKKDLTLNRQKRLLSEISFQQTIRDFRFSVESTYYDILQQQLIYKNEVERFKTDTFFLEENKRKYDSGVISEFEFLDYQREYLYSQRRMISAEKDLEEKLSELAYTLHLETLPNWDYRDVSLEKEMAVLRSPVELINAAVERSFDLANLRNAIFSSEVNLEYLRNQRLPELRLYARATYDFSDNNFNTNSIESEAYNFGIRLQMPLFGDRFVQHADILNARYDEDIAEANMRERIIFYKNEIRKDLIALEELQSFYEISNQIATLTERDFELSKERFRLGSIGTWDSLRAKNQYFNALNDQATAKYRLLRKLSEMKKDYPLEGTVL